MKINLSKVPIVNTFHLTDTLPMIPYQPPGDQLAEKVPIRSEWNPTHRISAEPVITWNPFSAVFTRIAQIKARDR